MRSSVELGRIRGVPIGLHWSILLIGALASFSLATGLLPAVAPGYPTVLYWAVALTVFSLALGSIIAHELAHTVVAQRHGIGVRRITLWLLGGVAEMEREADSARSELRIAAAGPAASAGLAVGFGVVTAAALVLGASGVVVAGLGWLALVNGVLALFNLIPARPMDGGRILTAVLWRRHGDQDRAIVTAATVARRIGLAMIAVGGVMVLMGSFSGVWWALIGWFVRSSATAERHVVRSRRALGGLRAAEVAEPVVALPDTASVSDYVRGLTTPGGASTATVAGRFGPWGLVWPERAAAVAPEDRDRRTLGSIAVPLSDLVVVDPTQPAAGLLDAAPGAVLGPIVVGQRGGAGPASVHGVITPDGLARRLALGRLLGSRPHAGV